MSQKSTSISSFLSRNFVGLIASFLSIAYILEYFVKGGIFFVKPTINAFSRAQNWALFITTLLLVRSIYVVIKERKQWWWHYIVLLVSIVVGAVLYTSFKDVWFPLYYGTVTAGLGAASALSAFAFIIGLIKRTTISTPMNAFVILMIVVGLIPLTPFADILGKTIYDASIWSVTTLMAGSAASQTYIRDLAALAVGVRTIFLLEKIGPRLMTKVRGS